jgi:MFS family permease
MTPTPPLPPRAWLTVALLWLVAFINFVDRTMVTTMHGSLVGAIPMTEAQYGLLTSVFLWVYGAMNPFAGFVADRFSRRWVILVSLFGWSLTTCLTSQVQTFSQLLAMRVLLGITESCYVPAAMALIADYHRGPTRTVALAAHQTGMVAGMMLGGLGGWLAEQYSWRTAFTTLGIPGLVYGLLLVFLLRDVPRIASNAEPASQPAEKIGLGAALASLWSSRNYRLQLGCVVLLGASGWIIIGWLPTYIGEHFGLAQGAAGFSATGFLNGSTIAGMVIGSFWTGRWSKTNLRAHIYVPVIGLSLAIPAMLLCVQSDTLFFALAWLVAFGVCRNFFDVNLVPIVCLIVDPRYRATGIGTIGAFSTFTGGVMIYLVGSLRDRHVDMSRIFTATTGCLMICIVLLLLIRFPTAPAASSGEAGRPL